MRLAHHFLGKPLVAQRVKVIRHFPANFAEADPGARVLVVHPQAAAVGPGLAGQDPDGCKSGKAGKGEMINCPAFLSPITFSISNSNNSGPIFFTKSTPFFLA